MEGVISVISQLSLAVLLVLLNGFFVASEFAIVKVRKTRIHELMEQGIHKAKIAQKVVAKMDDYLSATQLGITLSSLGLGWIGEPVVARLISPLLSGLGVHQWLVHPISFGIAFSMITFMHIVLGEIAPKSLAIRQSEKTTLWVVKPLHVFYVLFKPCIVVLNRSANLILKWMNISMVEHQHAHTEEEIRMLIAQSHKNGMIDHTELTLFDNIFDFTERVVREVMVPRVNMVCLYRDKSFEENLAIIRETPHTRFPLCGDDKDDIVGIIHIRDLYERLIEKEVPNLSHLARQPILLPETLGIKDVLRHLQKKRMGMAIVVDEFGGTSGLVTTEDIIEEIFGEIQDEFDNEQPFFLLNGNETSIDAGLLIDEVNDYFDIDIEDDDNDTIGGWFFSQLEKVPAQGDYVTYNGLEFTVLEVKQRQLTRLLVRPVNQEEAQADDSL